MRFILRQPPPKAPDAQAEQRRSQDSHAGKLGPEDCQAHAFEKDVLDDNDEIA